jgi:hypothetical protein
MYVGKRLDEPFFERGHSKGARKLFNDFPKIGMIKKENEE